MFKIHKEEIEISGKKITLETGKIARQADGAIFPVSSVIFFPLISISSL